MKGGAGLSLALLLLLSPLTVEARGHAPHAPHAPHASQSPSGAHRKTWSQTAPRNGKGRIQRSAASRRSFKQSHPCPSTNKSFGACPGYVIDHIRPLKRGGEDAPSNMQWQTREAAKQKDRSE